MRSTVAAVAAVLVVVGWAGVADATGGPISPTSTPVTAMAAGTPTTTTSAPAVGPDCGAVLGRTPAPTAGPSRVLPTGPWSERRVFTGSLPSVVDLQTNAAYAMAQVNRRYEVDGPFVLRATDLASHRSVNGPSFSVPNLALVDGWLWVFGFDQDTNQDVVCQVRAVSMEVIRQLVLPAFAAPDGPIDVAPGPRQSVWIGCSNILVRVSAATGRVLELVTLPAPVSVDQLVTEPVNEALYVSELLSPPFGIDTTALTEFDWRSGEKVAGPAVGPLEESVGGASLTAVPGGVWTSFRVGMSGASALFADHSLDPVTLPNSPAFATPFSGPFQWMMSTTMVASGDDLFVAPLGGLVVCLDGATGATRAFEQLQPSDSDPVSLVAADRARGILYATDGSGLLTIRPPAACWA